MRNTITLKKHLSSLFIVLMVFGFAGAIQSQSQYESGMQKALGLWSEAKPVESSAIFERIAKAEKNNWVPYYYAANTLITASFRTKETSQINELLKKANTFIEEGHRLSPDNSELITLEGQMYTGYVAMDPATYGMKYSNKITNLHSKAIALDPKNPRAQLNKIEFDMGTARFFGNDMATFCPLIKGTRPLFENQKKSIPFYPSYGVDRIGSMLKQCNCN